MYVYANLGHVIDAPAPPASRFSVCGFSRSFRRHSELQTLLPPNIQNLPSAVEHPTKDARPERATRAEGPLFAKSSICHRSENRARNLFVCHTSKFIRLKVLCLPHIRKTGGVGGLMLTSLPALPCVFSTSLLPCFITSSLQELSNEIHQAVPFQSRRRPTKALPILFRRRPPMPYVSRRFPCLALRLPRPRRASAP